LGLRATLTSADRTTGEALGASPFTCRNHGFAENGGTEADAIAGIGEGRRGGRHPRESGYDVTQAVVERLLGQQDTAVEPVMGHLRQAGGVDVNTHRGREAVVDDVVNVSAAHRP
jgi:hypothetical protein